MDEDDSRAASRDAFLLGDIRIDPPGLEIRRSGSTQRVEAKVMEVLLALARQPGVVLRREELEQQVWPGRFVTDDALTNAIGKLRRALDDNPRQPRFIETISKRGYRLKVSPTPVAGDVVAGRATAGKAVAQQLSGRSWLLIGLLLIVLTGLLAVWFWETPEEPTTRPRPGGEGAIPLAVMPFDVLGEDPSQTYFAEGISLDLITELSRIPGLLVIAPGTVFSYRDTVADDRRIAAELGVRYLIRGGVQRIGERIRINVRLLAPDSGQTLWAERFAGEAERLFRIQDEVVQGIARVLPVQLELPGRTGVRSGATDSIAAYDEFLRGRERYGRLTPEDNRTARDHFERALAMDPGFARAYAGLALTWTRLAIDGWTDDAQSALEKALGYAERAASIDPSVPQSHFVRAQVALFRGQHVAAAAAINKAIELDPNYADAYALLAWILHYAGRPDQADPMLAEALRRNPRSSASYREIAGEIAFATRRYQHAAQQFEAALDRNPAHTRARLWLAATLVKLGHQEDAAWEVHELLTLNPEFSLSRLPLAFPLKDPQQHEALMDALAHLGLPE